MMAHPSGWAIVVYPGPSLRLRSPFRPACRQPDGFWSDPAVTPVDAPERDHYAPW